MARLKKEYRNWTICNRLIKYVSTDLTEIVRSHLTQRSYGLTQFQNVN